MAPRSLSGRGGRKAAEGSDVSTKNPSPRLASLATPLPQGERGKRICVAQIGAPHGVRGEVRLFAYTEDPLAVTQYGPLESEDGSRAFEITSARPAKDHLV